MRMMTVVVLCLSTFVPSFFGSCAYGDPAGDSEISFSVPFDCYMEEPYCLADSFKDGLNVVLLGKSATCSVRTGKAFTYPHHVEDFEATPLLGTAECPVVKDETPFREYRLAVVGVDPTAVRAVCPKDDKSPVPKEMELKARKLAVAHIEEPRKVSDGSRVTVSLSEAQPKVIRTENVTLLIFDLWADGEPWEPGPTVALTNAGVFRLEGACTYGEPIFFSVNNKLYLTYHATVNCCGCGDTNFFVYDLSSGTPKMVYANSNFSD